MNKHNTNARKESPHIAFASDLHFEFHRDDPQWLPDLPTSADILILAGDIDIGGHVIASVKRIADHLPNTQILWIAGNHEFYGNNIDDQLQQYRDAFKNHGNIHFLENDRIELCGMTFLGCTLWTGFDVFYEYPLNESIVMAERNIADFHCIKQTVNGKQTRFLATDARERYSHSREWLIQELKQSNPKTTIVVTHFPPHSQLQHGTIPVDILSNYFIAHCDELIEKYQPKQWIYGHNHWSDKIIVGNTTIVSNQLGYPQEKGCIPEFNRRVRVKPVP